MLFFTLICIPQWPESEPKDIRRVIYKCMSGIFRKMGYKEYKYNTALPPSILNIVRKAYPKENDNKLTSKTSQSKPKNKSKYRSASNK